MASERDSLVKFYNNRYNAGQMSQDQIIKSLAEYDALIATKRLPIISVIATVVAAVSAIASAFAAYFAYAALHLPH